MIVSLLLNFFITILSLWSDVAVSFEPYPWELIVAISSKWWNAIFVPEGNIWIHVRMIRTFTNLKVLNALIFSQEFSRDGGGLDIARHLQFIIYQYCSFTFYSIDILFFIQWLALDIKSKVRKCLLCCLFHEELREHLTVPDFSSKSKNIVTSRKSNNFFLLTKDS